MPLSGPIVSEGTALLDISKGIVPFGVLQLIGLLIIIVWPQLVLRLPAVAYG